MLVKHPVCSALWKKGTYMSKLGPPSHNTVELVSDNSWRWPVYDLPNYPLSTNRYFL